jgi:hypothetical protein
MKFALLRAAGVGLLAAGLLIPVATTYAAPASTATGTLVGSVTCGTSQEVPAGNVLVAVEGINLDTHTSGGGTFTLTGLPAAQSFTIDAISDPQASSVSSRGDITVEAGQTLDIGNIDLAVCPQPAAPTPTTDDQPHDSQPNSE